MLSSVCVSSRAVEQSCRQQLTAVPYHNAIAQQLCTHMHNGAVRRLRRSSVLSRFLCRPLVILECSSEKHERGRGRGGGGEITNHLSINSNCNSYSSSAHSTLWSFRIVLHMHTLSSAVRHVQPTLQLFLKKKGKGESWWRKVQSNSYAFCCRRIENQTLFVTLLLLLNVLHLNVFQVPEIDNFYLDMNGIIHNCSSVTLDTLPTQLTRHNFVTSRTLDGLPRRPNYPCPFEVGGQIIPAFVLTDCALLFFCFLDDVIVEIVSTQAPERHRS